MKVIKKEAFLKNKEFYIKEMKLGKIFIYPTDSIYGIGCNALIGKSVEKIRKIKGREQKPFSIIAPEKNWIEKNCYIDDRVKSWLEKLPGKYTLVLELKNWDCINNKVNFGGDSLGVRIPDNWFSNIVKELGEPFVTTSVNKSGEKFIEEISELQGNIRRDIDYFIDSGKLNGK